MQNFNLWETDYLMIRGLDGPIHWGILGVVGRKLVNLPKFSALQ